MRFGLSLPMQHPMGDDLRQRFAELVETVRLARQAGFHHLSASQHVPVQPVKTGITPPLAILFREQEGEKGPLHLAGRLHERR